MTVNRPNPSASFGTPNSKSVRGANPHFQHITRKGDILSERLAFHFVHDPVPKFILNTAGIVLNINNAAARLLDDGIVGSAALGGLDYGSMDNNDGAKAILHSFCQGRSHYKRLIKRTADDSWVVFEFLKIETDYHAEVLLTVQEDKSDMGEELMAISKAFDLTITESEVVQRMAKAYCPKEIGNEMDISVNTVRAHLRSIYSKIGVRGYNKALRLILQLAH